jgi:sec-independent protein translocase protein TatA
MSMTLLAFMGIGPTELVVVGVVMLLLFGNRVPEMMRGMGRGIREFKAGVQGIESDLEKEAN